MSERPEMITASYVPGGTAEVHESLPGSASNSARSSGPSAADVIFASSKLGPADPLFFCVRGLYKISNMRKRSVTDSLQSLICPGGFCAGFVCKGICREVPLTSTLALPRKGFLRSSRALSPAQLEYQTPDELKLDTCHKRERHTHTHVES